MTPKTVEIDGKQYVVTERANEGGSCKFCAFRNADHCHEKTPHRIACKSSADGAHLLSLGEYTKQKLKGEVL